MGQGFSVLALVWMLLGLLFNLYPNLPRLPGDISIDKPNLKIYIPVVSAIIASVILTLFINSLKK